MPELNTLQDVVTRCDEVMANAWMVRTFVKHSEEIEDFPELEGLMGLARTAFDAARALETRVDDPPAYLHMLRKKIGRLKKAAEQFEEDAFQASVHTNFVMAVRSMNVCVRDLQELLDLGTQMQQATTAQSDRVSE
ncbi:MAG: amidohydrolase [Planctomycetota bacterium]|jgi:hypothetical protein